MKEKGYSVETSAAITSSSASIGIVIPPSIPMILYGAITGTSVGTLFVAGLLPGILIGVSQLWVIYVLARRYNWGSVQTFSWLRLGVTALQGLPGLVLPAIIIGGIIFGVFTPTEAGAVAGVYGIAISMLFYRSLTLQKLYRALVNAGVLTAVVMIVISTSFALGWVMANERIPNAIASWATSIDYGPMLFLMIISLVLIALGAIMHGDPLLLIMVPIFYPAMMALGIHPIHFGMVVVFCIAIGQQTPPVGSTLFVVSAIARRDIFSVSRANIPFVLALVGVLVLVIGFPAISLGIPRALGMID
jgi:C4-dicarboxylate transporter DctM subunit